MRWLMWYTWLQINNQASGVHESTFTRHSTGHIRCHHQSYREADVDGERLPQGVSTEDGLSDWATAKQLTNKEEDNSSFSQESLFKDRIIDICRARTFLNMKQAYKQDFRIETTEEKKNYTKFVTYNQDKRPQEFCQEFLEYSMFECTVLPHASLVLCFNLCHCAVKTTRYQAVWTSGVQSSRVKSPPLTGDGHSARTIDPSAQPSSHWWKQSFTAEGGQSDWQL